jgi:hypothetical protein
MKYLLAFLIAVMTIAPLAMAFEPLFDSRIDYALNCQASYSCVADFNNDGWKDIAVVYYDSSYVGILFNYGNGTFRNPVKYPVIRPSMVISRDFNGDDFNDLAVISRSTTSNRFYILFNNGAGQFDINTIALANTGLWSEYSGDFDGDNDFDLALVGDVNNQSSLVIMTNNGQGSFTRTNTYPVGYLPYSIYGSDLDLDGDIDLAVGCNATDFVSIFLNNGSGSFTFSRSYAVRGAPNSVFIADVNNDSFPDIAVAEYDSSHVSIMFNNGSAVFDSIITYHPGYGARSVCLADIDSDGDNDMAVANSSYSKIAILPNDGTGLFGQVINYPTSPGPKAIILEDINNDGDKDMIISCLDSKLVSIWENNGNGTFPLGNTYSNSSAHLCAFDYQNDGYLDLALGASQRLLIAINDGFGNIADTVVLNTGHYWANIASADLNGDNLNDLVMAEERADSARVLLNNGGGSYHTEYITGINYAFSLLPADIDNDGDLDLVVSQLDSILVLFNNGQGSFPNRHYFPRFRSSYSLIASDFNGDGYPDLATYLSQVYIFFNDSSGTYFTADSIDVPRGSNAIGSLDCDNDGDTDILLATSLHTLTILKNNGLGIFNDSLIINTSFYVDHIVTADFNQDGSTDICTWGYGGINGACFEIFLNSGYGTFTPSGCYGWNFVGNLIAADMNNDGLTDIATDRAIFINQLTPSGIDINPGNPLPKECVLLSNYPNPFNAQTIIQYNLPLSSEITLSIFDILGRKVATLIDEPQIAGHHQVTWNAVDMPSGIYFYRVKAGKYTSINKMLLLK